MTTPIQQATALIHAGFAAQGLADWGGAEIQYRAALRLVPAHPAALQLLGLLLKRSGDLAGAEDLMRRSLRALPAQPHVWNNLGNLLGTAQRAVEALSCFEEAIALDAGYADGHYNRARLLLSLSRAPEALTALERASVLSPQPSAAVLHLASQIHAALDALPRAMQAIEGALSLAPDKPALLHTQATLLQRSHRYIDALRSHERAQVLGLDAADAHYNRGNTLQSLGRLSDAAHAYRAALQRDPLHELALYDLARLRWRQGDPGFDDDLKHAARQHPESTHPPAIRAQLLWRAERYADAAQAYRVALAGAPDAAGCHDGLGRCLVRLGDRVAGLASQQLAARLAPQDAGVRANLAASLLLAGQVNEAEQELAEACRLAPHDQYAWALRGLAWRLLGDARATHLNPDRFVQVIDLEPPQGYADMHSFNTALAAELLRLHHDADAPVDQTLRRGTQTLGDIFEQGHVLVDALKVRISQAIDGYVRSLPTDPEHRFLSRCTGRWRYADSWSSRLRDTGFHTNHVHPHGWISSAYYVQVPAVCADTTRREGWLRFGLPDLDLGLDPPLAPSLEVQPQPGRLALFPSMLWHGTAPFHAAAHRLTIAFDVLPR